MPWKYRDAESYGQLEIHKLDAIILKIEGRERIFVTDQRKISEDLIWEWLADLAECFLVVHHDDIYEWESIKKGYVEMDPERTEGKEPVEIASIWLSDAIAARSIQDLRWFAESFEDDLGRHIFGPDFSTLTVLAKGPFLPTIREWVSDAVKYWWSKNWSQEVPAFRTMPPGQGDPSRWLALEPEALLVFWLNASNLIEGEIDPARSCLGIFHCINQINVEGELSADDWLKIGGCGF